MKSEEYWRKRFERLEDAQMNKGAAYFAELEKQYTRASKSVQREIDAWYARFAVNNEISLQEAKQLLNSEELDELKWNVMEYIEKGREYGISGQWAKQLENASSRFHVSRLDALKLQMQNHVEVLYGTESDEVAKLMEKLYTEGYYHTAYEIQKGFNVGYSMMKLDTNMVEKVISKPWAADGSNFSSRIWKQKTQLVSDLHNNLTQAIIRGKHPHEVTEEIAKRFDVSKGQAGRLVMTESAYFASASTKDAYNDLDVEQYEILATLDTKTSQICRDLDGKVFKMSDYQVGVTAPPFHAWCRTTTVPYFDDEFELGSERAARDEDGETYYVPDSMKYEEWYEKYIDNSETSTTISLTDSIKLNKAEADSLDEYVNALKGKEQEKWIEAFTETDYAPLEEAPTDKDKSHFDPNTNKVYLDPNDNALTAFHETAHAIDEGCIDVEVNLGTKDRPSIVAIDSASAYLDATMDNAKQTDDLNNFANIIGAKIENDWFAEDKFTVAMKFNEWASNYDDDGFPAVSDILSGITKDYIDAFGTWGGHETWYWEYQTSDSTMVNKEAWANFCSLKATKNTTMLNLLKSLVPNRYKELEFVYKEAFLK